MSLRVIAFSPATLYCLRREIQLSSSGQRRSFVGIHRLRFGANGRSRCLGVPTTYLRAFHPQTRENRNIKPIRRRQKKIELNRGRCPRDEQLNQTTSELYRESFLTNTITRRTTTARTTTARMTTIRSFTLFLLSIRVIVTVAFLKCSDPPGIPDDFGFQVTYNTTRLQTKAGPFYRLDAIVEWNELNFTDGGVPQRIYGYAVRMGQSGLESARSESPFRCENNLTGYQYTPYSRIVFENLSYGFEYQIRIRTANLTTRKTAAAVKKKTTSTPDCYEATGDEEFCTKQPVEVASKPRDLMIDCSEVDLNGTIVQVSFSWLVPLQINGTLTRFVVRYQSDDPSDGPVTLDDHVLVDKDIWNKSSPYRFNSSISYLEAGHVYTIRVFPYVVGDEESGEDVQGNYNASLRIGNGTFGRPCPAQSASSVMRIEPALLAGLLCATAILVVIIAGFVYLNRRRFSSQEKAIFVRYPDELSTTYSCSVKKDTYHIGSTEQTVEVDPVFYKMEFDRSLLKMEEILGSGQFGTVYKGFAYGIDGRDKYMPVAVKSLRDNANRSMKEDFLEEIKLIVEIGSHPNIQPILGCCTTEEPHYLITELMKYGDLLHFLWKCREMKHGIDDPIYKLTATGQLQIAIQIARGMEYLSTTLYYHGDLAARNVLVGDGLICKISDFGLADDIYQRGYKRLAPERKRPVKWVSLETNTQGKCSIQSDVWSFGIVLYEIYTLGGVPYPGMDGRQVIAKLQQGYRMERPSVCPEEIWDLARSCWFENPHSRPTFTILYNALDAMLTENVDYLTDLETDYSVYEFVPCVEADTWEESETTGEADDGLLPTISKDLHIRQNGKNCKFEAKQYRSCQQISHDSAFSDDSALSGELDELNLWWHLTDAAHMMNSQNLGPSSGTGRYPSIEFVPFFDYDSDSYKSEEGVRGRSSSELTMVTEAPSELS